MSVPTGFTRDGKPITVEMLGAGVRVCLLCEHPDVVVVAVFYPTTAVTEARIVARSEGTVGPVAPGKVRGAVYGLCAPCLALPSATRLARVEARLLGTEP